MSEKGGFNTRKTIKVEGEVYEALDQLRGKGETFSQVIASMLLARTEIFHLVNILEEMMKFREWQRAELERAQTPHG